MVAAPCPGKPTRFTLKLAQSCYFVLDPVPVEQSDMAEGKKVEFCHLASCIPQKVWLASECLRVTWYAKWTIKGLSPIRPVIVLKESVSIAPQSALLVADGELAAAGEDVKS